MPWISNPRPRFWISRNGSGQCASKRSTPRTHARRHSDPPSAGRVSLTSGAPSHVSHRRRAGPEVSSPTCATGCLRGHGRDEQARALERTTIRLVERGGIREYYDPVTGEGLGADEFSWTAAAVVDIGGRAR